VYKFYYINAGLPPLMPKLELSEGMVNGIAASI